MCGRFFRHKVSWEDYFAQLSVIKPDEILEFPPAYNVAPTQSAPIIRKREDSDELESAPAVWGLIPSWWKKPLNEKKFSTFNAKGEDAASKSTFRSAFKNRPCLVPMSGYYEWKGPKGAKQAFAIGLRNRRWFYAAGLWDRAVTDGEPLDSFTIVTTTANDITRELHARMPVIPEPSAAADWIRTDPEGRQEMVKPYGAGDMHAWKVGKEVGNVRNQGEALIAEIDD